MPNYFFEQKDLEVHREYNPDSYRNVVDGCINEINTMLVRIAEYINSYEIASAVALLTELQQVAIDLGTYTEMVKGDGYDIVTHLEHFCEDVFLLSECLNNFDQSYKAVSELAIEEAYYSMDRSFSKIVELYNLREEVVFICLRPEFFKHYYKFYKEAIADSNKDVYIIPIPWYKKNAVGLREKVYLFKDGFPEEATIFDYQKYLVSIHEPETVYIQFPQDQFDDEMDIFEEYYSLNLRKYTNRLVLIPYREYPFFSEEDTSFYYSMKYYVTMPGVICADNVLLYDDWNRELYIKKLVEFAGEDTRELWESKIHVVDKSSNKDLALPLSNIRKKWDAYRLKGGNIWRTSKGELKKIVLFQPIFSSLFEHGMDMVDKIESSLEIFKGNQNKIVLIWIEQIPLFCDLDKIDGEVAKRYRAATDKFISEANGIFISDTISDGRYDIASFMECLESEGIRKEVTYEKIVIEIADAYYGGRDYVARQFVLEQKPVLIQNISVK